MIEVTTLIPLFTFLGCLGGVVAFFCKVHKWYLKQEEQTAQIGRLNRENQLMIYALFACLDGLSQLGANHTVPKAKEELEKHLNIQAHTIK